MSIRLRRFRAESKGNREEPRDGGVELKNATKMESRVHANGLGQAQTERGNQATSTLPSAQTKGLDMTDMPHFDALIQRAQNKDQLDSKPEIINEEVKERISKKDRRAIKQKQAAAKRQEPEALVNGAKEQGDHP